MRNKTLSGLVLVALAAVVGYALITLPSRVIDMYERAAGLGSFWATAYLVTIGLGLLFFCGAIGWLAWGLWRNTRRKRKKRDVRGKDPGGLTARQLQRELDENLAEGSALADDETIDPQVRAAIAAKVREVIAKRESQTLQIVAFGTISSGKSSLLNALAGREVFRSEVSGGTTTSRGEVPWPGMDRVVLVDTPGLAEVRGEHRAAQAAAAAQEADIVLFVVDGPLKSFEVELLRSLAEMQKRLVVCLNKEDWYDDQSRQRLLAQIASQAGATIDAKDVVAVQAKPGTRKRVRVLADGTETEEEVPLQPDIEPLARRMMQIVQRDGRDLLLGNLLLSSRGLVDDAKRQVRESLDRRADEIIGRYMWGAGSVAAVNPIPLLDLAGGTAISTKMVLDLAQVYRQEIDVDAVVTLLGQLGKNLIAMLGATAATPVVASLIASMLKTVPGVGTIAGGMMQGLVQALVTRWIGKVFCAYFRGEMQQRSGALSQLAREKWAELTTADELRKLVRLGREHVQSTEDD